MNIFQIAAVKITIQHICIHFQTQKDKCIIHKKKAEFKEILQNRLLEEKLYTQVTKCLIPINHRNQLLYLDEFSDAIFLRNTLLLTLSLYFQ